MDHAIHARRPLRSSRLLAAACLLLSACSDTKVAPTAPTRTADVVARDASSINVAAAVNGATVVASSVHPSGSFPVNAAIDGDRLGTNWGNGGGWNDGTFNSWPDWLEVSFAGSQTIGEVDVFTIQDAYWAPVTPTPTLITQAGLTDFRIEAWDGSAWVVVPNGTITGSTTVWTQVTFAPVTTTKLRLWITNAKDNWSRVAELEAWTVGGGTAPGAFGKTSPANGATPAPSGISLSWAASSGATSYEYCVDSTNNTTCEDSWVSTTSLSATLGTLAAGTTYYWQVRARNATGTTDANGGTWWSFSPTSGSSINVAAAANGATVVASSVYPSGAFPVNAAINGDRLGTNWGNGGGWNDGTSNSWPDWLEVSFAGSQTIGEVDVFTIQDAYWAPVTPTLSLITQAGLTDFRIEAWDGSAWVVVPNGTITGTNKVWTQVTFAPVTTTKLRLWITNAKDSWSRVAELEAWTAGGGGAAPGAFGKTSPATGAAPAPSGITLNWAASSGATSYEYCVDQTNNTTCDGSWVSTTGLTATLGTLVGGTTYYWQVRARNATGTTDANGGTWWSFTPTGGSSINVAAAANGATVVASSVYSSGAFPVNAAINGDRLGTNWGNGGGWNDGTFNSWPDWLEVSFAGSQTIGEVDVFTIQDAYWAPVTPTLALITQAGLTDFRIEAWDGSAWVVVPNGTITGSNKVWTQVTFPAVTTTKLRLWITNAKDNWSRVAELEAWTAGGGGTVPGAFGKTSPTNGATPAPTGVTLNWAASSGATSYEYCFDSTNNTTCDGSWVSTTGLSATLGTLVAGTTYYWQVRARNATGTTDANGGTWWSFTATATSLVDLVIEQAYVTQATQKLDGSVALVAGRDALLRVFARADRANSVTPTVRARIYDGATLLQTLTLTGPAAGVPQAVTEGTLSSSWNIVIAGANVRTALRILVDIDPTNTVAEGDEGNNSWPATGTPQNVTVNAVPTFNVRFVPVAVGSLTGNVSVGNMNSFLASTRLQWPVNTINASVRAPFTSSADTLTSNDSNGRWLTVLSEINSLRSADGAPATTHYYGVVKVGYNSGVAGYGYVPGRAAVGWDYLPSGDGVAAHEWGHNFNREHSPCGGPASPDPSYPYAGGIIGAVGWNSTTGALVPTTYADLMGYCNPTWVSDYNWSRVMTYRQSAGAVVDAPVNGAGLLVWGRVVNGRVLLEPAFRITAPRSAASTRPTHMVEALDADGNILLELPIAADRVDHATDRDERHFAAVVPWTATLENALTRLRVRDLRSPLLAATQASASAVAERRVRGAPRLAVAMPDPQVVTEAAPAGRVRVRWDQTRYPMAMVRDAASGQIMGYVRQSGDRVVSGGRQLEVVVSDGVRSVVKPAN